MVARTTAGMAAGAAATSLLIFEGFYDIGVIGKAAWDSTSFENEDSSGKNGCSCKSL